MDTDLFVHFAEIAGIFVGFGALIGLRSAHVTDLHDVIYLKSVLMMAIWVVIFALVPIIVQQYGVHDHALWLPCAVAALVTWLLGAIGLSRSADMRAFNKNLEPLYRFLPVVGVPMHLIIASSLALIIIGALPTVDEALYMTALSTGLVFGGYALLVGVLSQKHQPESDES
ncbi:hypothetical protein [Agromyces bauzanensis]